VLGYFLAFAARIFLLAPRVTPYTIGSALPIMKTITGLAFLAGQVAAFPRFAMDALTAPLAADVAYKRVMARQSTTAPQGAGALPLTPPPFDASEQLISVSGAHAFVPPGAGDARGMCPGLNALANQSVFGCVDARGDADME